MEEIIINTKPRKESNLISQEIHTELRRLIEVQGNSERNTAKILNISRVTVKSNLKKERPKYQRIAPYKKPVSDRVIFVK